MKSVLISIKPQWCALIASGKKTVEVRKTRPKLETPFRCYIYCTKSSVLLESHKEHGKAEIMNGKVIGEFVCEHIDRMTHCGTNSNDIRLGFDDDLYYTEIAKEYLLKCQLSYSALEKYANGGDIYGWHISDLKIYDEPKELSEFRRYCDNCSFPILPFRTPPCDKCPGQKITNAPQSWCYVDGLGDTE